MYAYSNPGQPFAGLGDVTNHQLAQQSGAIAGGTIAALAPLAGPAAPLVALAGVLVSGISALLSNVFSGCGQTCVVATKVVDQIEPYLKQNLADFQAGNKSKADALAFFAAAWQQVVASCSDPSLGDAGKRCISDRQAGGKWDWFAYYRDPIANAPDDPSLLSGFSSALSALPISPLWLGLGLVIGGLALSGGEK